MLHEARAGGGMQGGGNGGKATTLMRSHGSAQNLGEQHRPIHHNSGAVASSSDPGNDTPLWKRAVG